MLYMQIEMDSEGNFKNLANLINDILLLNDLRIISVMNIDCSSTVYNGECNCELHASSKFA